MFSLCCNVLHVYLFMIAAIMFPYVNLIAADDIVLDISRKKMPICKESTVY